MPKPEYNPKQGGAVTFDEDRPLSHYDFQGVTARVFPLKADMATLSRFCRRYLNTPKKIVEFRPALPYVYLAVLHYGKMSSPQQRFWISQNEVTFAIPLERYHNENDRTVLVGWAYVNPFIFVDDDISLTLGREVYGWPKVAAQIDQKADAWLSHPRSSTQMMTLRTAGFLSAFLRKKEHLKTLLEINFDPPPTFSQLRPDYNPLSLLLNGPRTILEYLAMMYDGIEVLAGLPMLGFPLWSDQQDRSNRQTFPSMMARGLRGLSDLWSDIAREQIVSALVPDLTYNTLRDFYRKNNLLSSGQWESQSSSLLVLNQITLKQFRDAQEREAACYQAFVQSQITVKNLKNGGLLGDLNLLQGDAMGGFQILMHCHSPDPDVDLGTRILDSLGLEVVKKRPGDKQKGEGLTVAMLKPLYPFWAEMDLKYGDAKTICWRGDDQDWYYGPTSKDPRGPVPPEEPLSAAKLAGAPAGRPGYNPAGTGTLRELEEKSDQRRRTRGKSHEFFLSVYPLLAEQDKLKDFCNGYLNDPELSKDKKVSFETVGSYVYLIVMSLKDKHHERWTPREVAFSVPVKWFQDGKFADSALVSPFIFVETDMDAVLERELNGRPVMDATLETPGAGLPETGSASEFPLLTVKTEVIPQANQAQQASEQLLLEVYHGDFAGLGELGVDNEHGIKQRTMDEWKKETTKYDGKKHDIQEQPGFKDHLEIAKVLAFEVLFNQKPINSLTLKQFRDADEPTKACYQAIVQSTWEIEPVGDLKKSWRAIKPSQRYIKIYQRANQPIVESLGLIRKDEKKEGITISYCEPKSPFWLHVEMTWKSQKNIYWRVSDEPSWHDSPNPPYQMVFNTQTFEFVQTQTLPGGLSQLKSQWEKWARDHNEGPVDATAVADSIDAIKEPHLVLESLLKDWASKD